MTDIIKKEGASTGDFRSDNHFLLGYFEEKDHALYYRYDAERVIVEDVYKRQELSCGTKL